MIIFIKRYNKKTGFSLAEVAIVITIMALLVITVLGGRSLIAAAGVQKVINEITTYEHGVLAFYMEYNYLPGNFPNTNVWLEDDIKNTCNKVDGDLKKIDGMNVDYIKGYGNGYVASAWRSSQYPSESDIASCHLALSGYLPLNKLGRGVPNVFAEKALKTLSGKLSDDLLQIPGYWIDNKSILHIHSQVQHQNNVSKKDDDIVPSGNSIVLSGKNKNGYSATGLFYSTHINSYVLSSVDKKIDDGKPGAGKVRFGTMYSNKIVKSGAWNDINVDNNDVICNNLFTSNNATFQCLPTSKFQNIRYNNTDSGYMIYQPKWMYDLTE